MTKTLTEQWREGTLPEGYYYIRWSFNIDDEPSYMLDFYDRENFTNGAFINIQRKFIDEVMCVVPSYDKVKEMDDELKELATKNDTLAIENGRLKEKLAIATKALKEYANRDNYNDFDDDYYEPIWNVGSSIMHAELALKEMEGVK